MRSSRPSMVAASEPPLAAAPSYVTDVASKERKRRPAPPFTTSTLQQEASRKLGFTTRRTMQVAQKLYEGVAIGEDGTVKVEMTLTTPSCPSAQELPTMVEEAVRTVPNVSDVEVEVVWDPPWDPSRMSEDARLALNMY